MKFNKNKFSADGIIRKYRTLAAMLPPVHVLLIASVTEAFFSSVSSREKLQIIYANIRV